jgi:xylose isomerase
VRRGSFEPEDLFLAHIAGVDTFAWGLKAAAKIIEERVLDSVIEERYASFREGIGKEIVEGKATLKSLEAYALQNKPIVNRSGRQERIKLVLNEIIYSV